MLINQRILFNDNGTEYDHSIALNDYLDGSAVIPYVDGEDYLYIASDLPFNQKYFIVDVANDQVASVNVEIWFDNAWVSAVDILDQTATSGVSLAKSGLLSWKTNREKGWSCELDSEDVDGVSAVGLYSKYWLRISWSASLNALTELSYCGVKWCDDNDLAIFYPELSDSDLQAAFASGKTDWIDQEIAASEGIVTELTSRNIIKTPAQVLNTELFKMAAVHKTAHLIFSGMGRSHDEDAAKAKMRYEQAMNMKNFQVDLNADANLSSSERIISTSFLRR